MLKQQPQTLVELNNACYENIMATNRFMKTFITMSSTKLLDISEYTRLNEAAEIQESTNRNVKSISCAKVTNYQT